MPVDLQNRLFKYFTDTLSAIITQAKKTGRYDLWARRADGTEMIHVDLPQDVATISLT